MAEGGCTTCCALLSAAFVLIGCAEPLAISTSESMIVLLHFFTTRRQAQLPDSLTPSAAVTVGCMTPRRSPVTNRLPKANSPDTMCNACAVLRERWCIHLSASLA